MRQSRKISTSTRIGITVVVLVGIAALLWAFLSNLPKGYSDDLSRIGKGGNTVVLVYDKLRAASGELMGVIDQVRDDYQGRVEFLVADVNTPAGSDYISEYAYKPGSLIFYTTDGRMLTVEYRQYTRDTLKAQLDQLYPAP